jgi:RpiB/LacA/LacB family sugar-phosphate isomerase
MRVVLGSDHAGFEMKRELLIYVHELGFEVIDVGTDSTASVDYPDYAEAVGRTLKENRAERGILICGSGVGASVAANKIPGIRAGLCHDAYSAHQGVEHDDMNVLVLGSRVIAIELARDLVREYLAARFSGEERHVRRLAKVKDLESRYTSTLSKS